MKYSYNWLKEISKTKMSPEKMADLLMMHSFEVEGIEKKGEGLEKVVVGKILEVSKHPNADKLQLTKVDIGAMKLDIVCGAMNIKVDDKVPVALIGAKLPNGIEIKEVEIRGVKSCGMLCATDELGTGNNHSGIMILDKDAKVGEKLSKNLGLDDTIFEIKVLPDRSHDALSHIEVAREVAALDSKKIDPCYGKIKLNKNKTANLSVKIQDKDLCPRYIGALMTNIKVQESPAWIKSRLLALGINPINNIVDATNYVMLELGQPLHAFDCDLIGKDKKANIIIRRAKNEEEIKLLDGTLKKLSIDDLVIANEEKALAIAGIMGGENSGINEKTTSIVIESANFNAVNIRKSRTSLGIKTEASDRYEKEIDPNLCEMAIARVIEIIEMTGGKLQGITDVYPKPVKEWKVKLDFGYVNKLLGENIPAKKAIQILNSLELKAKGTGKIVNVTVPTIRIDLKTQEDLIEEIGRIFGYEKINPQPLVSDIQAAKINEKRQFERMIKNILTGAGYSEMYNYSFYSIQDAKKADLEKIKHLELENPMNPEQAYLRASLIPGILKNIKENLKYSKELEIFESGRVYLPGSDVLPVEKNMLVLAIVLDGSEKGKVFYEAKGYVDLIFQKLGIQDYYFDEFKNTGENIPEVWHKTRCAEIEIEGSEELVGYVGEINPLVLGSFGVEKRVAMIEIDLEKLQKISEGEREFKPLRKFPTSERDISLIAGPEVRIDDILQVIQEKGGKTVLDSDLFDIFDLPEGKTSFAFHIIFGAEDKTLKNDEVDLLMKKITESLEKDLKIKVRK